MVSIKESFRLAVQPGELSRWVLPVAPFCRQRPGEHRKGRIPWNGLIEENGKLGLQGYMEKG